MAIHMSLSVCKAKRYVHFHESEVRIIISLVGRVGLVFLFSGIGYGPIIPRYFMMFQEKSWFTIQEVSSKARLESV